MIFGAPAPPGEVEGDGGAARWKQRALYDAMKDAFAAGSATRLARLSVHDRVGKVSLEVALRDPSRADLDALTAMLETRAT